DATQEAKCGLLGDPGDRVIARDRKGSTYHGGHRGAEKSTSFTIRLPRCARSAGSATTSKFGRMEKRRQECLRHTSDCVALGTIRCFQHSGWEWMCYSSRRNYLLAGACLPEAEASDSALISSRTWRTAAALGSLGASFRNLRR